MGRAPTATMKGEHRLQLTWRTRLALQEQLMGAGKPKMALGNHGALLAGVDPLAVPALQEHLATKIVGKAEGKSFVIADAAFHVFFMPSTADLHWSNRFPPPGWELF